MLTNDDMRKILRRFAAKNTTAWAKDNGFSRQYIHRAMYADGKFPASIAKKLGYKPGWIKVSKPK